MIAEGGQERRSVGCGTPGRIQACLLEGVMDVLVINCGSSSVKADVLNEETGHRIRKLRVQRVGTPGCSAQLDGVEEALGDVDCATALTLMLPRLVEGLTVAAVGHRVVHGGARFSAPARIDAEVEAAIEALCAIAPLRTSRPICVTCESLPVTSAMGAAWLPWRRAARSRRAWA